MDNNFEDRDTALHESARKGLPEIVNVLLTAGAGLTINKKLMFNYSPANRANEQSKICIVRRGGNFFT